MWTPLRKTRTRLTRLADNAEDVTRMLAQSTGVIEGIGMQAGETITKLGDEASDALTDTQQHVSDLYRRYNRLADTIETAVIVLTVIAVLTTVAVTVKELVSE